MNAKVSTTFYHRACMCESRCMCVCVWVWGNLFFIHHHHAAHWHRLFSIFHPQKCVDEWFTTTRRGRVACGEVVLVVMVPVLIMLMLAPPHNHLRRVASRSRGNHQPTNENHILGAVPRGVEGSAGPARGMGWRVGGF